MNQISAFLPKALGFQSKMFFLEVSHGSLASSNNRSCLRCEIQPTYRVRKGIPIVPPNLKQHPCGFVLLFKHVKLMEC